MELGDDAGQPVGAQHLGGDDVDAAVVVDSIESSVASSAPESASLASQYCSSLNAR